MSKHTRTEILDTAKKYVTKDRAATHGDMESNLTTIAKLWSVYLETKEIKPHEAVTHEVISYHRGKVAQK